MKQITFQITKFDALSDNFNLKVDGEFQLEVPSGELRKIFNEMEKFARLRFKGELSHKKNANSVKNEEEGKDE